MRAAEQLPKAVLQESSQSHAATRWSLSRPRKPSSRLVPLLNTSFASSAGLLTLPSIVLGTHRPRNLFLCHPNILTIITIALMDSHRRNQQAERRSQQHDFSRSCIVDTVDGGGAGLAVRVLDRGEGEIGLRGRRLQTQSTDLDRMVVGANSADGHFCQRTDRYCVNDGCERERNLRRNRPTSPKRPAPNRKRLLGSAVVMVSKSMAMYA
jgi:hypothetical protein